MLVMMMMMMMTESGTSSIDCQVVPWTSQIPDDTGMSLRAYWDAFIRRGHGRVNATVSEDYGMMMTMTKICRKLIENLSKTIPKTNN